MLGENMLNSIGSDYQGVQVETSAWRQTLTRGFEDLKCNALNFMVLTLVMLADSTGEVG